MTDDLRARIARALRDHDRDMDGAEPAHEADGGYGCCVAAVMGVVQLEIDRLNADRDRLIAELRMAREYGGVR
jgi:hypothetical protein